MVIVIIKTVAARSKSVPLTTPTSTKMPHHHYVGELIKAFLEKVKRRQVDTGPTAAPMKTLETVDYLDSFFGDPNAKPRRYWLARDDFFERERARSCMRAR